MKKFRPIRILKSKNNQYYVIINGQRVNLKNLSKKQLAKLGIKKTFQKIKRKQIYTIADLNKSFKKRNTKIKKERQEKKKKVLEALEKRLKEEDKKLEEAKAKEATAEAQKKIIETQTQTMSLLKQIKEKGFAFLPNAKPGSQEFMEGLGFYHSKMQLKDEDGKVREIDVYTPSKEGFRGAVKQLENARGENVFTYKPIKPDGRLSQGDDVIVGTPLVLSPSNPSSQSHDSNEGFIRRLKNEKNKSSKPNDVEIDEIRLSDIEEEEKTDNKNAEGEVDYNPNDKQLGEGLYGYEIEEALSNVPGFEGVFSGMELDNLELNYPITSLCYLIEEKETNHWVSIFIDMIEKEIDWYNSFGVPAPKKFKNFFKRLFEKYEIPFDLTWKDNYIKMQSDKSNNCGVFACDFIEKRTWGNDFKDSTNFSNISENEKRMARARVNFGFV